MGLIVVEVVDAIESRTQDLVAAEEVAQIGPAEIATGIAATGRIQGTSVARVCGISDTHNAIVGEEVAIARIACRHHTIEHVYTA